HGPPEDCLSVVEREDPFNILAIHGASPRLRRGGNLLFRPRPSGRNHPEQQEQRSENVHQPFPWTAPPLLWASRPWEWGSHPVSPTTVRMTAVSSATWGASHPH